MRRQDFIDDITTWSELIEFCNDEDCDICGDIYSEYEKDEYIDGYLVDLARNNTWQELYDFLESIPTGDGYYYRDDYGDWHEVDDYIFDERKDRVLEWMDDGDWWDEEDEEECEEPINVIEEVEEDLTPVESDVPLDDLFTACNNGLKSIQNMQQKETESNDEIFNRFVMSHINSQARDIMYTKGGGGR